MKKILIQSSTEIDSFPEYKDGIKNHAKKILPGNYSFDIAGVTTKYSPGGFMASEFLNSKEILQNIINAEKDGYDAVVLHCFLDPVLDEAREIVDIPVVGMAESSMLLSQMYGKKFAVITHSLQLAKKEVPSLIKKYDLNSSSINTQYFDVSLMDLENAFSEPETVIKQFLDASETAVEKGAEVILPGCGLLNIVCAQNGLSKVRNTGATILNVTGATLKMADTKMTLKDISGTTISRNGYYEKPRFLPGTQA